MWALSFETSAAEISSGRRAKNERKPNINNSNCRTNLFCSVSVLPGGRTVIVVGMFNQISINIHACSCTVAPSGYRHAAQSDLLTAGFLSFSSFVSHLRFSFCLSFYLLNESHSGLFSYHRSLASCHPEALCCCSEGILLSGNNDELLLV